MASVTFSVADEVKSQMGEFSWINWSELAREEVIREAKLREDFEKFERIVSKSKLTEADALQLAKEINKGMHKQLKKLYPELS